MDYLAKLREDAKRPEHEPSKPAEGAFGGFEGRGVGRFQGLSADLVNGLLRLSSMRAPSIQSPRQWPEVVADAERLARGGWAQQALGLGWEALHLFGCSPLVGGDEAQLGLAVQLAGRRIVLLDSATAIMESKVGTHSVFRCRPMPGSVLLWDLHDARRG